MKFSVVCTIVALAVTSAKAGGCAEYRKCWCIRNQFMYQGKVQDNIAWDDFTVAACVNPGSPGYKGLNFKECERYRSSQFGGLYPAKGIDQCDWDNVGYLPPPE
ncbi:hypothetical protein CTA2_11602 [Colletotrichum tanaceti]|nr:hypothetical protein CTA2_11602 [Colletotrichum tanaceti]